MNSKVCERICESRPEHKSVGHGFILILRQRYANFSPTSTVKSEVFGVGDDGKITTESTVVGATWLESVARMSF